MKLTHPQPNRQAGTRALRRLVVCWLGKRAATGGPITISTELARWVIAELEHVPEREAA